MSVRSSRLGLILLLLAWLQPGSAANLSEDQIKSAYVFNFAKFVEWPAESTETDKLTICVIGNDVLGGILSTLDGRQAGKHELHIIQNSGTETNYNSCHLVYIGTSEQRRLVSIIKSLGEKPPLTISDIENFAEKGGSIGFVYRANKIVFEINLASVQKSRLRLPSQLLNLASYVFER